MRYINQNIACKVSDISRALDIPRPTVYRLLEKCKNRGVFVALSIDGTKFSGNKICDVYFPEDLFEKEVFVDVGKSMLRRFQIAGGSADEHVVKDRLLLTY